MSCLFVSDKNANPYGTGQPVAQDIVLEGMKSIESKLNKEAENSKNSFIESNAERERFIAKFVDNLRKAGINVEAITSESVKAMKQRAEQASQK
jgi:hypothetical protein